MPYDLTYMCNLKKKKNKLKNKTKTDLWFHSKRVVAREEGNEGEGKTDDRD